MACANETKTKQREEETEELLDLKGNPEYPQRFKLIQESIKSIAYETPSKKVQREDIILNGIHHFGIDK